MFALADGICQAYGVCKRFQEMFDFLNYKGSITFD